MATHYLIPIVVEPYPEGGYGVRSPLLPELISDGGSFDEAVKNAEDAVRAVLELYEDIGKELPQGILIENHGESVILGKKAAPARSEGDGLHAAELR